jgi:hypothetical protein
MSEDTITITIPDDEFIDYKIDVSNYTSSIYNNNISPSWGTLNSTIGANGSSGSYYGNVNYSFSNSTTSKTLQVDGDAEFDGDVKIKGVSITDAIDKINKRLAILVPDPAKLEHFEALKRAYEAYKTLEALCELPSKDD